MRRILVEGWRFVPHSYALVNQFQCLEMLRRPGVRLYHRDALPPGKWGAARGFLDAQSEEMLAALPNGDDEPAADVSLRISFPLNFSVSRTARTVVFATAEHAIVPANYIAGEMSLREAALRSDAVVVTPSNWSRGGFIESGMPAARVVVVPHGFEAELFHPVTQEERREIRARSGLGEEFLFLHVGGMSKNKNIALLLEAFAVVCQRHGHVRLGLKGLDQIYESKKLLQEAMGGMSQAELALVQARMEYWGGTYSTRAMAHLYQSADAYVSPYCGEAFNLPVLEAAACGIPVICTAGGATDDFTTEEFAWRISSRCEAMDFFGMAGKKLMANKDALVAHMLNVVEDERLRSTRSAAGAKYVGERFTWKHAVDRLLPVLCPSEPAFVDGDSTSPRA